MKSPTCENCKKFYEGEPKEWTTLLGIGFCDYGLCGKMEVRKDCQINTRCDNEFVPIITVFSKDLHY